VEVTRDGAASQLEEYDLAMEAVGKRKTPAPERRG
jgi:hypothetical protein